MLVTYLVGPTGDAPPAAGRPPGWSGLAGEQWPVAQHALRAGITVMLVPLVWNWLELPGLAQSAVTVTLVMAVPSTTGSTGSARLLILQRATHSIVACVLGGILGLLCISLSVDRFVPWMLMLTAGVWIAAHIQASERGIGYVGTQGAIVFICTLVQGAGPPTSILPGIERLVGITGGMLILAAVSLLTESGPPAAGETDPASPGSRANR